MTTHTARPLRSVRVIGLITMIVGALLVVAGGTTWAVVSNQLANENITVADDASMLAGRDVRGPLSAYAQADIINQHALASSDGKTYAELDREDPARATVMNASFLRASLFTSVVAYGVSALVMGMGVVVGLLGFAVRRLGTVDVPATAATATA